MLFVLTSLLVVGVIDIMGIDTECGKGNMHNRCCVNYYKNESGFCEECPSGTFGVNCKESCPQGFYGRFCIVECHCKPGYFCHSENGCRKRSSMNTTEVVTLPNTTALSNTTSKMPNASYYLDAKTVMLLFPSVMGICCLSCSVAGIIIFVKKRHSTSISTPQIYECNVEAEKNDTYDSLDNADGEENQIPLCYDNDLPLPPYPTLVDNVEPSSTCGSLITQSQKGNIYFELD